MINYVDFSTYKRTLCFDLTRISDRLQSPTEPVNLTFQANRADVGPNNVQLYFLTERLNQVTFRFSSSDVAIGQHADTLECYTGFAICYYSRMNLCAVCLILVVGNLD